MNHNLEFRLKVNGMNKRVDVPKYRELINPTFQSLHELGGSGTNDELCEKVIELLKLSNEVIDESHLGSVTQTELQYQLAWARTYLKNYGAIESSARTVWSITPQFSRKEVLDVKKVMAATGKKKVADHPIINEDIIAESEKPFEAKQWQEKLSLVLLEMDPYAFERLTQRLLRECGFDDVKVTKKSGDGGIDGTGKLKINGIFSFNIAFQCKRYKGKVSSSDIRNFRGSLSTDIEKGVFITTGTFSRDAINEATTLGKQQIDLIDGEEFITKLAEFSIGVKPVIDYEIDEDYFVNI